MRKRRRHFKGQVIHIKYPLIPFLIFLALLAAFSQMKLPQVKISSNFLLTSISRSFLSFGYYQTKSIHISPYDILQNSILSIKASDVMSKKYAAKYGGVIKTELKKAEKKEPEQISENIYEADVGAYGIKFINSPNYSIDAASLLSSPLSFQHKTPAVLIVHTHTSEAYAESSEGRSENNHYNVVSVGKAMKEALEAEGIEVIHDITQNDNPSYNKSYKKALGVIEGNVSKFQNIEVVIDLHRDYITREDGSLLKPMITTKSGEKAAQIMFVVGTDAMGLDHPNWRHNLSFAVKIQNLLNETQPGLCRSINLRTERFNQHVTKGSMILEVGTSVNTIEEAKLSGRLAGEAIAKILKEN